MPERHAPMLMRLAILFALTDLQTNIDARNIDSVMAWIEFATISTQYFFVSAAEEAKMPAVLDLSNRALAFLQSYGKATLKEISSNCFNRLVSKNQLDACLDHLLNTTPPKISVTLVERVLDSPSSSSRFYEVV